MNISKSGQIKDAFRELEIILEGLQGIEELAAQDTGIGRPTSKAMIPLILQFEVQLKKLQSLVAKDSSRQSAAVLKLMEDPE